MLHFVYPLGSLLAKFGFEAVISPVSVADKAKSSDFDLWPDINLIIDLLRNFLNIAQKVHIGGFRLPPRPPRYGHPFAS